MDKRSLSKRITTEVIKICDDSQTHKIIYGFDGRIVKEDKDKKGYSTRDLKSISEKLIQGMEMKNIR
jgi:hypothetical protein